MKKSRVLCNSLLPCEHNTVAAYIRRAQAWLPSYLLGMLILPVYVMHNGKKRHGYACPAA